MPKEVETQRAGAEAIKRGCSAIKAMTDELEIQVKQNPQHDAAYVINDLHTVLNLVQGQLLNTQKDMAFLGSIIQGIADEVSKKAQEARIDFMKIGVKAPNDAALLSGVEHFQALEKASKTLQEVAQAISAPTKQDNMLAEAFDSLETVHSGSSPSKLPRNSA